MLYLALVLVSCILGPANSALTCSYCKEGNTDDPPSYAIDAYYVPSCDSSNSTSKQCSYYQVCGVYKLTWTNTTESEDYTWTVRDCIDTNLLRQPNGICNSTIEAMEEDTTAQGDCESTWCYEDMCNAPTAPKLTCAYCKEGNTDSPPSYAIDADYVPLCNTGNHTKECNSSEVCGVYNLRWTNITDLEDYTWTVRDCIDTAVTILPHGFCNSTVEAMKEDTTVQGGECHWSVCDINMCNSARDVAARLFVLITGALLVFKF